MKKNEFLKVPFNVLQDFINWLKTEKISGIIIGGIAASILGRPRVTRDIDSIIIINENFLKEFIDSGQKFGFIPRIKNIFDFAHKTRVLLMRHELTGIDIDISLGALPFEYESIERAVWINVGNLSLPLPTPEDLIIMKAIAQRPRDILDIESIIDAHPDLDLNRILLWVKEFSSLLEMPEMLINIENIISKNKKI